MLGHTGRKEVGGMHTTNRREVWDQEQLWGDMIGPVEIMKRS